MERPGYAVIGAAITLITIISAAVIMIVSVTKEEKEEKVEEVKIIKILSTDEQEIRVTQPNPKKIKLSVRDMASISEETIKLRRKMISQGIKYDPPIEYVVTSRTGLIARKGLELDSPLCEQGKITEETLLKVNERRIIEVQLDGLLTMKTYDLVRMHVIEPFECWVSEKEKFVGLIDSKVPEFCTAVLPDNLEKRQQQAYNNRGELLRNILDRDCNLDIALISFGFNVEKLTQDVMNVANQHVYIAKESVRGQTNEDLYWNTEGWSAIPLRSISGALGPTGIRHTGHSNGEYKDTPAMQLCPYISSITKSLGVPVQKVRIMKLKAGGYIAPHQDFFPEDKVIRLHIPIITNDKVEFNIRNVTYRLLEGNLYFTNVRQRHWVRNGSDFEDRIHLVMDIETDLKWQELIQRISSK